MKDTMTRKLQAYIQINNYSPETISEETGIPYIKLTPDAQRPLNGEEMLRQCAYLQLFFLNLQLLQQTASSCPDMYNLYFLCELFNTRFISSAPVPSHLSIVPINVRVLSSIAVSCECILFQMPAHKISMSIPG